MKKISKMFVFFFLILFIFFSDLQSKAQCFNADFSSGNFTGWQGFTGSFTNCCPTAGIVNGRHTIINTPGTDPRTGNNLQMIPPGANFSARLGNHSVNSEAERLRYTMTVTPQSALFIYKYAVVLEDPGHTSADQPKFNIRLLNQAGNLIDPVCGFYSVVAAGNIPGFQTAPGTIRWKDWSSVGIDLTPYMGQTITIEYTTYDCALGAHYGYAYLSATCAPMVLNVGFCVGNATVTMSAPDGFMTYHWLPDGQTTQTISIINPVVGTNYSCVMTAYNGCQVTLSTILEPTAVTADFNILSNQCSFNVVFQDNSSVNQGVVDAWLWDFGDGNTSTQQNPTHIYTNPGVYTVTLVSSSVNCPSTPVSQTVHVFPPPPADAGIAQPICSGGSVVLTASGGISYVWSDNSQTQTITVSPTITTTYTVTVTDANSCTASDNVVVTVNPLPAANAGADQNLCEGESAALNATGGTSYFWSPSTGLSAANIPNPTASPTTTTSYTVSVTDANGCMNTDDIVVNVVPLPSANAGTNQSICFGETAVLAATGGTSYLWSNNANTATISVTPTVSTTYTVTVTNNNCTASADVAVTVNQLPVANAGQNTAVCYGQSITLNGSGGVTYQWSPSTGLNDVNSPNPIASPTTPTTYTLVVTDANGCTGSESIVVGIYPAPQIDFTSNINDGCEPLTVQFSDLSSPAIQSWLWNFGDNNTSTQQHPTHEYQIAGQYNVSLTVTTSDGCTDTHTINNMIDVYPIPIVNFTTQPEVGAPGSPINFTSSYTNANATWNWNFGDGTTNSFNIPTAQHTYNNMGTFTVIHTVETQHGCTGTIEKDILIITITIPNVFTPNGDGVNDYFVIDGIENITHTHVIIFNRWGKKVYESNDYKNDWDGGNLSDGVYYYIVAFKDNIFPTANGTVTILR